MTAVIKAIFFTGLLNMKLLAVGVMLKLGLIIGKLLYASKIAFGGEKHGGSSYPQFQSFPAVFYPIPVPSQSHFSHDSHLSHYDSELHRSDEHIYGAQQSNYQHIPYQQSPQPIYKQNQQPVYQQTQQYYQPQQPTYQSYSQQIEPIHDKNTLVNGNYFDDTKASLSALSPDEMTKILSEAIAKISATKSPAPTSQRRHLQRKRSPRLHQLQTSK